MEPVANPSAYASSGGSGGSGGSDGLRRRLRIAVQRHGPIPFRTFMDDALYGDDGFYTRGGGAGRRRDFLTSPEVGPLFGAVIAHALDAWWDGLGRPDPYVVVECGAGTGTLCRAVLHATPRCAPALRYLLVERSATLRQAHRSMLPLVRPSDFFGAAVRIVDADDDGGYGADDGDEAMFVPGQGPLVASLESLPSARFTGVVLANELLDNIAFDVCQRTDEGWAELRIGEDLAAVLVRADAHLDQLCARLAPNAGVGSRIPIQRDAARWLREALDVIIEGRVVVIDYAAATAELALRPWRDWLRTYRSHGIGSDPLDEPGSQDITSDVAVDQLASVRLPDGERSQAEFLRAHGIDGLVEEGRRVWRERAAIGDLAAMMARSRVMEADALMDPAGLGRFRVLEWIV